MPSRFLKGTRQTFLMDQSLIAWSQVLDRSCAYDWQTEDQLLTDVDELCVVQSPAALHHHGAAHCHLALWLNALPA